MPALACPYLTRKSHFHNDKFNLALGEIEQLAEALRSRSIVGQALRTLAKRVVRPDAPYAKKDLETLLLLSLALRRAQERK